MSHAKRSTTEVVCPCCGARLKVDLRLGQVIAHEPSKKRLPAPDLDHAAELLRKEAERREDLFRRSAEGEKTKAEVLERKFEEALKKTQGEPPTRPLRDIDLD